MEAMLIECILKREGGTKVDLCGQSYHFRPDDDGRHVAMVSNPDHIGCFLSITEGYRIPRSAATPEVQADPGPTGPLGAPPAGAETSAAPVQVEPVQPEQKATAAAAVSLDRDALADLYLQKLGRKPHPAMSPVKMLEAIKAAEAA